MNIGLDYRIITSDNNILAKPTIDKIFLNDVKRLQKEDNKIVLLLPSSLNVDNHQYKIKLEKLLKLYNIPFNNIKYMDNLLEALNDESIDLVVTNSDVNSKKVININTDYKKTELIKNVYNKYIEKNIESINKKANDEIKPLSGVPSFDKPWLKYYSEEEINLTLPKMRVYDYLRKGKEDFLNKNALIYYGRKFTYKELFDNIEKYAKSFMSYGIKEGDVVSLCMPNVPESVFMFYALNRLGAIANMIHPLKSKNEIKDYVNEVESKMLVTIDAAFNNINEIADELCVDKTIVVSAANSMPLYIKLLYNAKNKLKLSSDKIDSIDTFLKNGEKIKNVNDNEYKENQTAVMMHTGGTSGKSKAVQLTNDNFNCMIHQQRQTAKHFASGDTMLTIMPVFHGYGLCSSVHMPLSYGISVILIPKFEAKSLKKTYEKYNVNHMFGTPKLIELAGKQKIDLSNSGYLVSGGEKINKTKEEEINDLLIENGFKYKLRKGFGMTEVTAGATLADDYSNKIGSVGIPLVCNTFKVVRPGTQEELGYYEKGELCITGPTVMKGYLNNEEENKKALQRHKDGKIWLHTGDMGYIDEDGQIFYVDRLTRMYTSGGFNVYPPQIEDVIMKLEEIDSCAVVPMKHPEKDIKVPKVFIILKQGYELNDDLINKIREICLVNLDKHHQPFDIESIEKFPETQVGKTDYKKLELKM